MALYLIKNDNGDYQEILQISCIVEVKTQRSSYRLERKLVPDGVFQPFTFHNSYELSGLEDIGFVENLCKKKLFGLVKEQRDRKKFNHRARISNVTLWSGDKKLYDLGEEFTRLWDVTDEQLKDSVDKIRLKLMGNGAVHKAIVKEGYLI